MLELKKSEQMLMEATLSSKAMDDLGLPTTHLYFFCLTCGNKAASMKRRLDYIFFLFFSFLWASFNQGQ